MVILSALFQADVFWLPNGFLLLLTPHMHAYLNNSTKSEGYLCGKITLFVNPEEGEFLATHIICQRLRRCKKNGCVPVACHRLCNYIPREQHGKGTKRSGCPKLFCLLSLHFLLPKRLIQSPLLWWQVLYCATDIPRIFVLA